jgi:two-component system NtrC family sensor kinase
VSGLYPTGWLVLYWLSAAVGALLTVLIRRRSRGKIRRPVTLLLANVATVLFTNGIILGATDAPTATLAVRFSQSFVCWLPYTAIRFVAALSNRPMVVLERATLVAAPLTALLSLATPWIIAGVRPYAYGFAGVAGPLYPVALGEMMLMAAMPIVVFGAYLNERRPLEKRQLANILVACASGMIAFVDILPVFGFDVPPLGWVPLDFAAFGLIIAIIRYRFLDIRMASRRLSWWLLTTLGGAFLFAALLGPLAPHLEHHPLALGMLAALLLVLMRLWVGTAQARVDRLVGRRRRDLDAEMAHLSDAVAALQTTEALGRAIDRFLAALDRRLAALVVLEPSGKPRVALSAWGSVPAPSRQSPLFAELRSLGPLVWRDQVRGTKVEVERACVRWGAEYLAPLVDGEELLGIVAVAPKAGGGLADVLELEALERMCVTVTAALASARLYERLRVLHQELEAKAEARQVSLATALRDLRGAEQRLVQSEKMASLGQIVAGVAADLVDEVRGVHTRVAQLRAHAETVSGAVDARLLAAPELADEVVRDMARDLGPLLDAVGEGGRRALAIAQDLSRFAPSADEETEGPTRAPARLQDLCDGTLKLCAGHLAGVHVVRRYDDALPPVLVESGPLGQVVLNLVLNATQAMKGVGTLTIATARCTWAGRPGAELIVHDTGPGIAPEILPRIFEPFFSTKGQTLGTGLGLSVSYGIVERHGGRIHVESTPGAGSTFRVQLPID